MSDPVTNMQIEDVLSSIRKLVSEEVRAQTRTGAERGGAPARAGKLILTPAQRVPGDDAQPGAGADDAATGEDDFDMAAFSRDLLAEADTGESEDDAGTARGSAAVSAAVAGRRAHPVSQGTDFEDEGANAGEPLDISAYAGEAEEGLAGFDTEETADEDDDLIGIADADEDDGGADAPIPSFLRSRGVSSLSDRIRSVPEAPQAAEDEPLSWEDHRATEDVARRPEADEIDGDVWAEPGLPDAPEGDGMMIDEEVLRDMVSEIVRQELQGALGERITRNVRKLVRREIQRALTAHDLL